MNSKKQFPNYIYSVLVFLGFILFNSACNDPTLVGSSLFDNDSINIHFTDTISIDARNILGDSSVYSDRRVYFVGNDESSKFGNRNADLFFSIERFNSPPDEYAAVTIDSMVLTLYYDTLGIDESNIGEMNFELNQLAERIPSVAHTTSRVPIEAELANYNNVATSTVPNTRDSISIQYYKTDKDSTVKLLPQLRIRLSDEMVNTIRQNDIEAGDIDSLFLNTAKGFRLKSQNGNNSFAAFKFSTSNVLSVYYNRADTAKFVHNYRIGRHRFNHFDQDYTSSEIEQYINSGAQSDELLIVEGMAGTDIEIDFSSIDNHQGKILNYAELEFYIDTDFQGDEEPITNMISLYKESDADSTLLFVIDALKGLELSQLEIYHNGFIKTEESSGLQKYRLILTAQINEFLQNKNKNRKLIVSVLNKSSRSARSVLYGVNHPEYPAKLRTIFTAP